MIFAFLLIAAFFSQGFNVDKIASSLAFHQEWEVVNPSLEIIPSGTLTYLGSGAQCYAFLSKDQQVVVKFFKMKHMTPNKWLKMFPLPGLERNYFRRVEKREKRLQETFAAARDAFSILGEETGVLYVHLNRTKNIKREVLLIGRCGEKVRVALDEVPFIVQKRAEPLGSCLQRHIERGDLDGAKSALRSLKQLIRAREEKGYFDQDLVIGTTYGFIGDQAVQIDFGRLVRAEGIPGMDFEGWVRNHYPSLLEEE